MFYNLLADLVVIIHFLFILFVVLGAFLEIRWPWIIWLHIPAFIWGILIELGGWACPLTPLEQWLRGITREESYKVGFIEHYLELIIYPAELTRSMQYSIAAVVLIINLVIYWYLLRRKRC